MRRGAESLIARDAKAANLPAVDRESMEVELQTSAATASACSAGSTSIAPGSVN